MAQGETERIFGRAAPIPKIPVDLAYSFEAHHRGAYKLESINLTFPNFLQISITSGSYNLCVTPAAARTAFRGGEYSEPFWAETSREQYPCQYRCTRSDPTYWNTPQNWSQTSLTDASREPN